MSLLGKEFVTDFGEFVTFKSEDRGDTEYTEPFEEFKSLNEFPIQETRNYQFILDSANNMKNQPPSQPQQQ